MKCECSRHCEMRPLKASSLSECDGYLTRHSMILHHSSLAPFPLKFPGSADASRIPNCDMLESTEFDDLPKVMEMQEAVVYKEGRFSGSSISLPPPIGRMTYSSLKRRSARFLRSCSVQGALSIHVMRRSPSSSTAESCKGAHVNHKPFQRKQ